MASIKIKTNFASSVSSLVNIEDEGAPIVSTQDLNFVGAGVTVIENPPGTAEINIPAVSSLVNIEDEGLPIVSTQDLNFVGAGVTVTENPLGTAEITIPGGGGVSVTTYKQIAASGDTNSLTGLSFGSTYNVTIPAGKVCNIGVTGGQLNCFNGYAPTGGYATLLGLYIVDGVLLPTGFYFGDANGQSAALITVGSPFSTLSVITPTGGAGFQGTNVTTACMSATIKNTSLLPVSLTFNLAVKRISASPLAAYGSFAGGRETEIKVIIY